MKPDTRKDLLEDLFRQLPEERLPEGFRLRMMQRVAEETSRVKQRNERLSLLAVIAASLVMAGMGVYVLAYMKVPHFSLSLSPVSPDIAPFYIYISGLVLLLLWGDYVMRKKYREKHK
jgi:hypothetical protein